MKELLNAKNWTGPIAIARIVTMLAAIWIIVATLIGQPPSKLVLPLLILMLGLGFVLGYQLGKSGRI